MTEDTNKQTDRENKISRVPSTASIGSLATTVGNDESVSEGCSVASDTNPIFREEIASTGSTAATYGTSATFFAVLGRAVVPAVAHNMAQNSAVAATTATLSWLPGVSYIAANAGAHAGAAAYAATVSFSGPAGILFGTAVAYIAPHAWRGVKATANGAWKASSVVVEHVATTASCSSSYLMESIRPWQDKRAQEKRVAEARQEARQIISGVVGRAIINASTIEQARIKSVASLVTRNSIAKALARTTGQSITRPSFAS
jgi:hypothetical protein